MKETEEPKPAEDRPQEMNPESVNENLTLTASPAEAEPDISNTPANTFIEMSKSDEANFKPFDDATDDYSDIGESQLMALCSGTFATQFPPKVS